MQVQEIQCAALVGLLATALSSVGCGTTTPPAPGVRVECNSNGANVYYKWVPNNTIGCEAQINEQGQSNCYLPFPAEHFQNCYAADQWLVAGGDTGTVEDTEDTGAISRNSWPTDPPSLTTITSDCTNECMYRHSPKSGQPFTCDDSSWILNGFENGQWILATTLADPGAITCESWVSANKAHVSPWTTTVIPAGSAAQWPSDGAYVSLACADVETCGNLFSNSVLSHLVPLPTADLIPNESEAEYLATSSTASASSLKLQIDNPTGPSQESNWVGGRIEYTALDCGSSTCPFYLGNLTLTNTTSIWELHSDLLGADVDVQDVRVRLARPVLGVWRPATGEVYLGSEMLDFLVEFDMTVGTGPATSFSERVTNSQAIFGQIDGSNAVEFANLSLRDGELVAEADLDYDSVEGEPPVAAMALGSTYTLPRRTKGLQMSSIPNTSTDPDGDLDYMLWIVDGAQVAPTHVMEPGSHTVRLEVRDSRYALDAIEQTVLIVR